MHTVCTVLYIDITLYLLTQSITSEMLFNIVHESSVTHFYYYNLYELHFEDITFVCNLFFDVVFEHFVSILDFDSTSTMYIIFIS